MISHGPSSAIDARARSKTLDRLANEHFDCVVIGGGMTGAGIAWQAALRGLRVALVEAADFAEGTSSRSTKLIHGGLRYLAMGDVRLVRATALERKVVHRLVPHLAEPRWLVVPARSWLDRLKLRLGIGIYERLGKVATRDRHQNWDADTLREREPLIDRRRFPYACVYREYATQDARLVLAVLRGAVAHGAVVASRLAAEAIPSEGGRAIGVRVRCAESQSSFEIRADCVINASGPWVDTVARLESKRNPERLHLSKGIHLGIRRDRLPLRHMALLGTSDGRRVFAIPAGSVTYVGTTDTTHADGPELWPAIGQADVGYLLDVLNEHFPDQLLDERDVATTWCGLRPLIAEPGKGPSEISRRDEVWIGPTGVVNIAGGKLTGFRPMALRALASAAEVWGRPLPTATDDEALPGGGFDGDLAALASDLRRRRGVAGELAERLVRLYGSEAPEVAALGPARLLAEAPLLEGEVDWAVCREGARNVLDFLYRRSGAAWFEPAAREDAVLPVARRLGALLGWSSERMAVDVERARSRLAEDLAAVR